jgi:hypothetical protein
VNGLQKIYKGRIEMKITSEQIRELKDAYESNKEVLIDLENWIEENGCSSDGLTDIEQSHEYGYNNAMEFVFNVLNI